MLALIVSGGHSQLVYFKDHFDYVLLGQTEDDAIGEAFDKVAKIVGLPYPGGPSVAKAAERGDAEKFKFPKAKMTNINPKLNELRASLCSAHTHSYDFSFSGVKTAVLRVAQEAVGKDFTFPSFQIPDLISDECRCNIAASFQKTAIETVVDKTVMAAQEFAPKSVVIAGGVAASQELRRQLAARLPIKIEYADPKLCTDNGAMIAALGAFHHLHGRKQADPYALDIEPGLVM